MHAPKFRRGSAFIVATLWRGPPTPPPVRNLGAGGAFVSTSRPKTISELKVAVEALLLQPDLQWPEVLEVANDSTLVLNKSEAPQLAIIQRLLLARLELEAGRDHAQQVARADLKHAITRLNQLLSA